MSDIAIAIFATVAALVVPQRAIADSSTVSIDVTAVVATVDDPNGFLGGQIVAGSVLHGTYTYSLSTPDTNSASTVGDYWHDSTPFGIRVTGGDYTFRTNPNNVDFLVELVNDHGTPASDNYLLRSYNNVIDAPGLNGLPVNAHISWQLDDDSLGALSSTELSTLPPVLSDWRSLFGLTIDDESFGYFIRAHVQSATLASTATTTTSTTTTTAPPRCGDGAVDAAEQCDPGVDDPSDCCSADCLLLTGSVCRVAPAAIASQDGPCFFPAFCNGVEPSCPANELRDGEVCVEQDTCSPIDACQAGHCLSGPRVCDVSVPEELVVGRKRPIPVTCGIEDGGRCRARAFVAAGPIALVAGVTARKPKRLCAKPVDGLCPITAKASKPIQSGSTKTLSLKLNSLGKRLLDQDEVQARVRVEVMRKADPTPILKHLVTLLRR